MVSFDLRSVGSNILLRVLPSLFIASLGCSRPILAELPPMRPPSVPLITSDPYLSVWSNANKLTDVTTAHWTGTEQSLVSLIRIDGVSYRLMGDDPCSLAPFPQTSVLVLPTRSIYEFNDDHVRVTMTFMQPALATDLSALGLPLSYITWDVRSVDGQTHSVQIYDSTSSQLAVNTLDQEVGWRRGSAGDLTTLNAGTTAQHYFIPAGDEVRINWGYVYAAASAMQSSSSIGYDSAEISTFTARGALSNSDDPNIPRRVDDRQPVLAYAFDLGGVGSSIAQRHVIVAYDEVYAINYFGKPLKPYWARNGTTVNRMLTQAQNHYGDYVARCTAFDKALMADMTRAGGSEYARITALAYRQTFAGMGLAADANGQPLAFPKENSSNGDIATVDVLFPMFPQLLLFSPTLAKAALRPVLDYSRSTLWTFPNAPHDLGDYPVALGRPDGGEAMPVEDSADMLIMMDAIAREEHSTEFADRYWPLLSCWARFLKPLALAPGKQLMTNDFVPPIDNSTNLDVKAIIALGAYAQLCHMRGDTAGAEAYLSAAQADVTNWITRSAGPCHWLFSWDDQAVGEKSGVQMYNLAMDQVLGTNLFPASVAASAIAYSKSMMEPYGTAMIPPKAPHRTSIQWSVWTASLATSYADWQTLITPIYNYLNVTSVRQPMSDAYEANNPATGWLWARPVVGGVFIKMLDDPAMWAKWSSKDTQTLGTYASFPAASIQDVILPSARETQPVWQSPTTMPAPIWRYTTTKPAAAWINSNFDDGAWLTGDAGFGTASTPAVIVHTPWNTPDIWLRRSFVMPSGTFSKLAFELFHDDDVDLYINGVPAAREAGYVSNYTYLPISSAALSQLVAGQTITIAVHCHQYAGGQGIDVGIVNLAP